MKISTGWTGSSWAWRKTRRTTDALAGVFRTIHTIKGTCGFLGFAKLEKVAHVGESLLTLLRDGELTLNPDRTTALLGMVDAVRQMLQEIESTGQEARTIIPSLREMLTGLQTQCQEMRYWLRLPTRNLRPLPSNPKRKLRRMRPRPLQKRKSTPCQPRGTRPAEGSERR